MAGPKRAEDLVPDENPLAELTEAEGATGSAAEPPIEADATETPSEEAPPPKPVRERPRRTRAERKARPRTKGGRAAAGERAPIVRLPKPERERGRRKERRGVVVSSAMDKTIVVRVDTAKPDRRYKKVVRRSRKFHAHDERNEANVGDVVRIVATRPLSKTKTWRLAEVLEAAR